MKATFKSLSFFLAFALFGAFLPSYTAQANSAEIEQNLLIAPTFTNDGFVKQSGTNAGYSTNGSNVGVTEVTNVSDADGDGKYLEISGRNAYTDGIRYNYAPTEYQKTYLFSAKIKLKSIQSSAVTAYITNDIAGTSRLDKPDAYHKLGHQDTTSAVTLSAESWTEVKLMVTYNKLISSTDYTLDASHFQFYVSDQTAELLMDDIKMIEPKNLFSYFEYGFADGQIATNVFGKDKGAFNTDTGTATVVSDANDTTVKAQDGDGYYAKVTGRNATNGGLRIINFGLQKGKTYVFSVWVRSTDSNPVTVAPFIESVNTDVTDIWTTVTSDKWTEISCKFTVTENSQKEYAHMGVKTGEYYKTKDLLFDNFALYAYEEVAVTIKKVGENTYTGEFPSTGETTLTLSLQGTKKDSANVYVAVYKGGVLESVAAATSSQSESDVLCGTITVSADSDTLKIFAWDADLKPLAEPVVLEKSANESAEE